MQIRGNVGKAGRYSLYVGKGLVSSENGASGPVWLDIPVNYQGMIIETDGLRGYDSTEEEAQLPAPVSD